MCKEQEHNLEVVDVKTLRQWERNTLQEVDAKYDPDDDSSDEEAIRVRKERQEKAEAKAAAEAELKAQQPGRKK